MSQQIVIARVELKLDALANWRHVAVASMWLREGTPADVAKATEFANKEGYLVLVFRPTETDPLGRAKKLVMNAFAAGKKSAS